MEPKLKQIGTQNVSKIEVFKKKCRKWFGLIIYYIYSLPAPYENLTFSHLEATKMQVFSAWCLGCRPGAAKWRSRGRKMARLGSPGIPKGAKGAPNASQNAPKMLPKIVQKSAPSPGLPPRVLPGCLGYPPAPKILPFLQINCPKPLPETIDSQTLCYTPLTSSR